MNSCLNLLLKHHFYFTEYRFTSYSPSLLAAACLAVAINGLTWIHKPWSSDTELLQTLTQLTDINIVSDYKKKN